MGSYLDSVASVEFAEGIVHQQNNYLCGDGDQIFIPAQNTDSQYTDAPV